MCISESVFRGHPDKIADQISDCVLDIFLQFDQNARVAVEVLVSLEYIIISGEVCSSFPPDWDFFRTNIRSILCSIYASSHSTWPLNVPIRFSIKEQSLEINRAVSRSKQVYGAGDQGIMVGYANSHSDFFYIPPAHHICNKIVYQIETYIAKSPYKGFFGPDGKIQICLDKGGNKIESLILSIQHTSQYTQEDIRDIFYPVISLALEKFIEFSKGCFVVNPSGSFIKGGPDSDTGLTGRKIVVDTYGPTISHGGGSFSGKDPTKVDRSAAYMARYIAKNIVCQGVAEECLVYLGYAIGIPNPVFFDIKIKDFSCRDIQKIKESILKKVDLTPYGICQFLNLLYPIYTKTSHYGHFGSIVGSSYPWEKISLEM